MNVDLGERYKDLPETVTDLSDLRLERGHILQRVEWIATRELARAMVEKHFNPTAWDFPERTAREVLRSVAHWEHDYENAVRRAEVLAETWISERRTLKAIEEQHLADMKRLWSRA